MVTLPVDPELSDPELGSEIELLADVMDVASAAPASLSQEQVDIVLGVRSEELEGERSHPTGEGDCRDAGDARP
jgi:hypothetical protein